MFTWGRAVRVAVALGLLGTPCAFAADRPPSIQAQWVDEYGKIVDLKWPIEASWRWAGALPVARVRARLPQGQTAKVMAKSSHLASKESSPTMLAIDLPEGQTVVDLEVQDTAQPNGPARRVGMILRVSSDSRSFLVHPDCEQNGVLVTGAADSSESPQYVGVHCAAEGDDRVRIAVTFSEDGAWSPQSSPEFTAANAGKGRRAYVTRVAGAATERRFSLAVGKSSVGPYLLRYAGSAETSKRWGYSAGLGFTSLGFQQVTLSGSSRSVVDLSETAMTFKGGVSYFVVPGKLDLGLSAYANAFSLFSSPATTPTALFYGVNGRVGWTIPWSPGRLRLSLSGGWYFWGMSTEGSTYGIEQLSGPQLFLMARGGGGPGAAYFLYFKYAAIIDDRKQLSFGSSELAGGLGYEIRGLEIGKSRTFVTLDLSRAQYDFLLTDAALNTLSIGLQSSW